MIREMLHKRRKYFCQVKTRAELTFWTDIGYLTISDFIADIISSKVTFYYLASNYPNSDVAVG